MKKCNVYICLEKRLQQLGVGPGSHWFKDILSPFWWAPSLAADESLSIQLASFIAVRLQVSANLLISEGSEQLMTKNASVAYKLPKGKSSTDVQYSTAILSSATDIITSELRQSFTVSDAEEIRRKILEKNPWVNFYALLDYCWSLKIPVLHVADFPSGKQATGWMKPAAVTIHGKYGYAIFLCTEHNSQSHFVFDLAHELGHIMKEHLQENDIHIDMKSDFSTKTEGQEKEANLFAEKLLGTFDLPPCSSPEALAYSANQQGRENHVDPGHLALHYGFVNKKYPLGEKALSIIEQKKNRDKQSLLDDMIAMINEKAFAALHLDELKPDDAKTLCGLTGIIQEPVL